MSGGYLVDLAENLLDDWQRDRCAYLIKPSTFAGLVDHVRKIQSLLNSLGAAAG